MTQQMEMFDKSIAEVRAIQVVNKVTGEALNWALEFRFVGEDRWNPVKLQVFGIDVEETTNEPTTGN